MLIDALSSFLSYDPLKNILKPLRFIEVVIDMYQNYRHPIKTLEMNNQFNTSDIISYLDAIHIQYQFAASFEFIERIDRKQSYNSRQTFSCVLAISSAKNKNLWLYSLGDGPHIRIK